MVISGVELDLTSVLSRDQLHDLLAARLGFPGYYGRNWDAFWDCITDPEQSELPKVLRIRGWPTLCTRLPREAELLRKCLEDLPAERQGVAVEWDT
jgi:ribonuclease inhibitor